VSFAGAGFFGFGADFFGADFFGAGFFGAGFGDLRTATNFAFGAGFFGFFVAFVAFVADARAGRRFVALAFLRFGVRCFAMRGRQTTISERARGSTL